MRRLVLLGACAWIASAAAACSPDSGIQPSGSGGAGAGTGAGATGGNDVGGFTGIGGGNVTCSDPTDSDGDGIADVLEADEPADVDGDKKANAEDTDSDGDGISDKDEAGAGREDPCDPLPDADADGAADPYDKDSDNDGVSDKQEAGFDPDAALGCGAKPDCDGDGVLDLIELAAGSDPTDGDSVPDDPGLFFVLPYGAGEKVQDFTFSTGVSKADIYFLIDTTASMQPAIDSLKSSISTKIIPSILNGDPNASPPIPPIDDAWIGVGTYRDVPWLPYGEAGDDLYRHRFNIAAQTIVGNVTPPAQQGSVFVAPDNVTKILDSLTAAGGGDGPEATTQALWIAATNGQYAATIGGIWSPAIPYPAPCPDLSMFGVPCFRKEAIPIFVIVTDAAFHNGPSATFNYNSSQVGGVKSYTEATTALNDIQAKIVGVPVNTGTAGAARTDLTELAKKTGSEYHDPQFGGTDRALVSEVDVVSSGVSDEVVRLLGLLSGAGLHDVTTDRESYECAGSVDCTGDGKPDLPYKNPAPKAGDPPFDAAKLITAVTPQASGVVPLPYASLDMETFHGVHGDAELTFRVHARNDVWAPSSLVVLRAKILVETPTGQLLGGAKGVKLVYFVLPEYLPEAK